MAAARFTQLDFDREMALVVFPEGRDEIVAVGRITDRPGQDEVDLGMTVADAWQGRGLGDLLMSKLLEISRQRGIARILGVISPVNKSMLNMARKYQFDLTTMDDGNFMAAIVVEETDS